MAERFASSGGLSRFRDRPDAGWHLARALGHFAAERPVVLGLPRGGVPVADEVAKALDAELDVIVVRKLGVPFQTELAMGAIGEQGVVVLNRDLLAMARVSEHELHVIERRERAELERRVQRFRQGREMTPLRDRTVIVVDDGIATGATARAALQVARAHGPRRLILAVPVAAPSTIEQLRSEADEVIALKMPEDLWAVGAWYHDFSPVEDDEVVRLLARAARRHPPHPDAPAASVGFPAGPSLSAEVRIAVDGVHVEGSLTRPEGALALVIFAHGSGSSRHSARNRQVAAVLQRVGLATLLFDLLTPQEGVVRQNVFDIELLAARLDAATAWAANDARVAHLPVGYFGASTGAAAALWAAAEPASKVYAVVSRGGRPDLALGRLADVRAPTLLLVGGLDTAVVELNRRAQAAMTCARELRIIPGATHLFEEPGTLGVVAEAAAGWFVDHVPKSASADRRS
ncbi:MAG: phosphoribosyltransferase family protein [Acidimicrobiales bacterium]